MTVNLGEKLNHYIIPKFLSGYPIIDAGSNIGNFIEKIRSMNIHSIIFAIEACNTYIDILKQQSFKNVILIPKALVGLNSSKKLIFTEIKGLPEWGSATDINEIRKRTFGKKRIQTLVETITLNDIIKKDIDYLKMDIEGSETDVINTLTFEVAKKIKQISFEVHNNDGIKLEKILQKLGSSTFLKDSEI